MKGRGHDAPQWEEFFGKLRKKNWGDTKISNSIIF